MSRPGDRQLRPEERTDVSDVIPGDPRVWSKRRSRSIRRTSGQYEKRSPPLIIWRKAISRKRAWISTVGRPPKRKISIPICRCRTTALPVPAITKQINGGANQFDCWSGIGPSEEKFQPAFNTDFEGALEILGLGGFQRSGFRLFLMFKCSQRILRNEYKTEVHPAEGAHFYIQDGQGGWIERPSGSTARCIWAKLQGLRTVFILPFSAMSPAFAAARWG